MLLSHLKILEKYGRKPQCLYVRDVRVLPANYLLTQGKELHHRRVLDNLRNLSRPRAAR